MSITTIRLLVWLLCNHHEKEKVTITLLKMFVFQSPRETTVAGTQYITKMLNLSLLSFFTSQSFNRFVTETPMVSQGISVSLSRVQLKCCYQIEFSECRMNSVVLFTYRLSQKILLESEIWKHERNNLVLIPDKSILYVLFAELSSK